MTILTEGRLTFTFPDDAKAEKIDSWAFYKGPFSRIQETKAVDFVCVRGVECWLVEVKDYRRHARTKPSEIWDEVALKARDTLACLAAARCNANVATERSLARRAFRSEKCRWRVALHLEWPAGSRLHNGRSVAANLATKLKQVLKGIDPHPVVADLSHPRGPWSVTSGSQGGP